MKGTVCLFVVLMTVAACPAGAQEPVYFPDLNLKAAVEQQLDISDPNAADMLALTYLDAQSCGIVDLTGLEHAANLTDLNLFDNQISNISALSNLTNLQILWLGLNQITDISAVSELTNLETLDLVNNQISDISTVSGLTNLNILGLYENQISDISALSLLTNLEMVELSNNPLNRKAYCVYLLLIETNNPGVYLSYDANPNPQTGDCDGDCRVNFFDFGTLAGQWLQTGCGQCGGADFSNDGNVDVDDLSILAYHWLESAFKEGDLDNDNDVDFADFALFAVRWRQADCGRCGGADLSGDENVNLEDLSILAYHWLERGLKDGDLDNDNDVDFADFALFAARWRQTDCGLCGGADLTGDGDVGLDDLAGFVTNWLTGVE